MKMIGDDKPAFYLIVTFFILVIFFGAIFCGKIMGAGIFVNSGKSNHFRVKGVRAPALSLLDETALNYVNTRRGMLWASEQIDFQKHYDDASDGFQKITGSRLPNPFSEFIPEAHEGGKFKEQGKTLVEVQREWYEQQIQDARSKVPEGQWKFLPTREEIDAKVPVDAKNRENFAALVAERTGFWGGAAAFIGTGAAYMTDPPVLLNLPFGAGPSAGRTTLQMMGRNALRESALTLAAEAVTQPTVQVRRKEVLGFEDAGFKQGVTNALTAATFSGTFAGILTGGGKGASNLLDRLDKRLKAAQANDLRAMATELRASNDPQAKVLADDLDMDAAALEENPFIGSKEEAQKQGRVEETPEQRDARKAVGKEHEARVDAADEALVKGELPDIPDQTTAPISGRKITRAASAGTEEVNPSNVNVDAKRFQFKSEADPSGVSERLQGVEEWDQAKANVVIVWEDLTGKQFVVDGHQRVSLARKLLNEKPDADIRINAIVRRESDGFSAENVRAEAAWKNISEADVVNPQLAIDAAIALRINPAGMDRLLKTAPRSTAMLKTVEGLIRISDRSLSHVINHKVTPNHAALVARLVEGEKTQDAIMDLLVELRADKLTDFEAESIVRQAR